MTLGDLPGQFAYRNF